MLSSVKINAHNHWVSVYEPLPNERQTLFAKYEVTPEMLEYALDPIEKSRVELDREANITLLIFDVFVPNANPDDDITAPLGIMITNNNVITFTNAQTNFVNGLIAELLPKFPNQNQPIKIMDLVLPLLMKLATAFFPPIRKADSQRKALQRGIRRRNNHVSINQFMELETNLVFILTSLQGNVALLQQLKRLMGVKLTTPHQELLDDIIIEAQQGLEMAQTTSDVVARISGAYSKVLDSNLNQTMKFLTVYSIILAIPPIVSGFYGENVNHLPFASHPFGWQITILITLIFIAISIWIMFNKRWWK
ncbi:MAG: magnesium transporter CorA family protein [Limosilactobacillus sp.]|nr:magnesium transporter CorA family protein [Limosilactobacillus sp.]